MSDKNIQTYDVIVLGAGSAGLTSAVGFAKVGKKVLLVEKEHIGGECTNSGCIPSKALLHHAKTYCAARDISGETQDLEKYRKEALTYVREKIQEILDEETPEHFEKMGIDVVMGEAEFITPCRITVNSQEYFYKKAVIATGSLPRTIDVTGLHVDDLLTNQNIFTISEIPEKLCILGAGPIGMELGQAFAMLGSKVTIISRDRRIAALEDPVISPIVQKEFDRLGIRVLYGAALHHVENKMAFVRVNTEDGNDTVSLSVSFDKFLMAIGRVPQIPKGLDRAKIEYDERAIMTDSQHRTTNKDVYAIGDVALRLKFTHTADDAARQVVTHVASRKIFRVNRKKAVPKVTYTSPEIAAVGLSYEEALKKYSEKEILRIEVSYSANDRARTDRNESGVMIVIARRLSGTVLGANIVGHTAGELISVFTLAIDHKISLWKLRATIYAYPTYSLLIKKVGDQFFTQSIANLKKDLRTLIKKNAPKIIALIIWGILLMQFQHYRTMNDLTVREMLLMLYEFVTGTTWGPIVYIAVYAIRPIIFFPATFLTALSGLLFGLPLGILYTVIGENASANLAYWIGRFFGSDLRLEDTFMGRWIMALHKHPFSSVLFMRLFYFPFDLTNYASGILRVPWSSYALATVIGIMPGLTTFVALGAGIKDIRTFDFSAESFDFVSLGIAVVVFVLSIVLSRSLKKWRAHRNEVV